jgi:hypothetical protein
MGPFDFIRELLQWWFWTPVRWLLIIVSDVQRDNVRPPPISPISQIPVDTPWPRPIRAPKSKDSSVVCINESEFEAMKEKAADLERRIGQISARILSVRKRNWKLDLDNGMEKFNKKLNLITIAKGKDISEIDVVYPRISLGSIEARVFGLVPKSGQREVAPGYERFLSIFDARIPKEVAKTDALGWTYSGVEGNISMILEREGQIASVVFPKVRNDACSIKKFYIVLRNQKSDSYGFFTGIFELKRGMDEEQIFQLPGYIKALFVRVVVLENWGDADRTCFDGLYVTSVGG